MTEGTSRRGDELLAHANQQQQANRASLLRSEQEQRDLGATGRLVGLQLPTTTGTTTGRNKATGDAPRRRPEPPTPTIIKKPKHNIVYFSFNLDLALNKASNSLNTRIYAGDGITYLDFTFDALTTSYPIPSYNWPKSRISREVHRFKHIVLPISADKSILIFNFGAVYQWQTLYSTEDSAIPILLTREDGGTYYRTTGTGSDFSVVTKCFYVGPNSVKEIATPASIENITKFVPYIRPLVVNAEYSQEPYCNLFYLTRWDDMYENYFSVAKFGDILSQSDNFNSARGPGTYSLFNNFDTASALYQSLDRVVGGVFTGLDSNTYYSPINQFYDGFLTQTSTFFVISEGDLNELPWYMDSIYSFIGTGYLPKQTLSFSNPDFAKSLFYTGNKPTIGMPFIAETDPVWKTANIKSPLATLPISVPTGWSLPIRTAFWDWGAPTYCRQQLLALGFTSADLVP